MSNTSTTATTSAQSIPPGAEDLAAADRILEGGSFAQAQSARPFVLAALREGRKLEREANRQEPAKPSGQRVRPWKADEVPLDAWVRAICDWQHGDSTRYLITAVLTRSVRLGNGRDYDFAYLRDVFECSTDGGRTWGVAGVVGAAS